MVGSASVMMNAKVLAENNLVILLVCSFSQSRINSKAISHTKNSWKVLPFHINSNDSRALNSRRGSIGFNKGSIVFNTYSKITGTRKASSGNSLNSVLLCFLRMDRMVCILRYQTQIE